MSQALSIAVAKTTIRINQAWYLKIMSTSSSSQLLISLEKEIAQIRALLSHAIHPKLLLDILLDPDFSIELIARDDAGSKCYYSPIMRTVYIRSSTHESNRQKLAILRNELHHVAVHFTNLRRQGLFPPIKVLASMKIVSPFFRDSAQIECNRILMLERSDSIPKVRTESDIKTIYIYNDRQNIFDGSKNNFFAYWFDEGDFQLHPIEKRYQSEFNDKIGEIANKDKDKSHFDLVASKLGYTWQVDLKSYNAHKTALEAGFERIKNFKSLLDQSALLNPNTFLGKSGKENLNKYLDAVKSYKQTDGITLDHNLKYKNITEIATAFIMDMEKYKKVIDRGYRNLPLSEKELELSSFVQEIDPLILQVFFPEWCEYFSQYHKVKNYCLS